MVKMAMYFGDKRNTGQYDNGVWMDILKIPFIGRIEEAGNYDIVIRTLWIEASGWSKEIRNRFPHVKQIGLSDHPLSTHVSKLPVDRQMLYINDLEYLDGIMALTEEERQWYSLAVPSKPVIKAGLPFPFEAYEEKYSALRNSTKKFIGLGVGASDNDRNFVSSYLVFRKLNLLYPNLQGVFLSLPSQLLGSTAIYADNCKNIYLHERADMGAFYDILSQCKFVINLADRNTPGRIQGEGAFFGVPVIGSNRLELQTELWPDLAVSPYAIQDALMKSSLILENVIDIEKLAAKAAERLQNYNYKKSKAKFNKLLRFIEGD